MSTKNARDDQREPTGSVPQPTSDLTPNRSGSLPMSPELRISRPSARHPEVTAREVPAAVYLRVSSDEQRENETVKTQVDVVQQFLAGHPEYTVVNTYVDDGVSGTIALKLRPQGRHLIQDALAGRFKVLLLVRADRLGRDVLDLLWIRETFEELGIEMIGIAESLEDEFSYDVRAIIAKHERKRFLARSREGMDRAAREGRYTGGIVAYGFRVVGLKQNARYEEDDSVVWGDMSAADVVRRIFHLSGVEGWSCRRIADELNTLGVPTHYSRSGRGVRGRATRGVWRSSRVRNLLLQSIYKGEAAYGRRTKKPRDVIVANVPALVSPLIWEAAQATLQRNRLISNNTKHVYLLRGLIRCECGMTYSGSTGKGGRRYVCGGRQRERGPLEGKCGSRSLLADKIESLVLADLREYLVSPGDILDELREDAPRNDPSCVELGRAQLEARLRELSNLEANAKRLAIRGSLTDAELDESLSEIASSRVSLEERIVSLRDEHYSEPVLDQNFVDQLRTRVDEMSPEEWRDVIPHLVRGIDAHTVGAGRTKQLHLGITYSFARPYEDCSRSSHDTGRGSSPR